MKKANPALKSMVSIALYLIATILIWVFVAKTFFPVTTNPSSVESLVEKNAPLLTQIAENNADPTKWAGIETTDTVRTFLTDAGVTGIETAGGITRFALRVDDASPTDTAALVYAPDDAYARPDFAADWAQIETERSDTFRWEDAATKGYVTVRKLAERFYYEEARRP